MSANDISDRARKAGAWLERASLEMTDFAGAFASVADLLDGRSFHVTRVHADGRQDFYGSPETWSVLERYYGAGWDANDTWSRYAQAGTAGGTLVTDAMLIPGAVRDRDPFFQEFCRDWDLGHYAAWTFDMAGERLGYTLIRPHGSAYSAEDLVALEALRSAANRAALMASAFRNTRISGIAEGLAHSGRPSLVLDEAGRIVFATASALDLEGVAFGVQQGLVVGLTPGSEASLRRLRQAMRGRGAPFPRAFLLSSPHAEQPVIGIPIRMFDDYRATLPGARAILMLVDRRNCAPEAARLREAFGLTAREAELAVLLASAADLGTAAAQMGLKIASARQLSKSLLAKTGSSRRSELVVLLQRMSTQAPGVSLRGNGSGAR